MFTIAARRMGYRVHTFSPDEDTPTGQVADVEVTASYDDLDAVRAFAAGVDVVTFEFENVPAATADAAESQTPVRPAGDVLHISQHRLREKQYLSKNGFPVAPFETVRSLEELERAVAIIGTPAILKSAGFGYDGKGQFSISNHAGLPEIWRQLAQEGVLEKRIDYVCEISVVAVRGSDGAFASYGAIGNHHENGILDVSVAPAAIASRIRDEAVETARALVEDMGVIGVLCVEFFVTRDGKLLINETAPRPHNSGHLTIDACVTSQFEQQLRAVCGLPLGSIEMPRPACMVNLLGEIWENGEPDWVAACSHSNAKIHLYGKLEPRSGRKMGHITVVAASSEKAREEALAARLALIR